MPQPRSDESTIEERLSMNTFGPVIDPSEEESRESNSEKFTCHVVAYPDERKIEIMTQEKAEARCLSTPVERKEKEPKGENNDPPL
jgi:hypothetical protein